MKVLQLARKLTKLARRASGINSFAFSKKMSLRTTLDELARPLVELQELLILAEDPYFERKKGGLRALKCLFELKGVLAQLRFRFANLDMVDGQLHGKDGSCTTGGLKLMTRAVNKLKMRSKTDEVASVGSKINKAYS